MQKCSMMQKRNNGVTHSNMKILTKLTYFIILQSSQVDVTLFQSSHLTLKLENNRNTPTITLFDLC